MDPRIIAQYFTVKLEAECNPLDLKGWLERAEQRLFILDVRPREAYARENIPQSYNIPLDSLDARFAEIPAGKTVVCYCWSVATSLAPRAAIKLAQQGHTVKVLTGGIEEWKRAGFPVSRAPAPLEKPKPVELAPIPEAPASPEQKPHPPSKSSTRQWPPRPKHAPEHPDPKHPHEEHKPGHHHEPKHPPHEHKPSHPEKKTPGQEKKTKWDQVRWKL
jgi:rhodanese-related sulfurtransferase